MNARATAISGIVLLLAQLGCATTTLDADVDPSTNLDALERFVVVKFGPDNRGIEDLIAQALVERGKSAVAVDARPDPVDADVVVTYQDKWMWDFTMYMIELRVVLRDPETDYVLATGTSYRTSLARKTPLEMAREVVGEIFGG